MSLYIGPHYEEISEDLFELNKRQNEKGNSKPEANYDIPFHHNIYEELREDIFRQERNEKIGKGNCKACVENPTNPLILNIKEVSTKII